MAYPSFMNFERISEEAHGGDVDCLTSENQVLHELGFDELCNLLAPGFSAAGVCDYDKFNGRMNYDIE
jgi:hypothetical protein